MIDASENYKLWMYSLFRRICCQVNIDWNSDTIYSDETRYVESITIERRFDEPLGGFSSAIADIRLVNVNDRFTPTL